MNYADIVIQSHCGNYPVPTRLSATSINTILTIRILVNIPNQALITRVTSKRSIDPPYMGKNCPVSRMLF
eukprot:SAG11_NODE_25391_length_359_cov_0.969231_1_plen_69_part_10